MKINRYYNPIHNPSAQILHYDLRQKKWTAKSPFRITIKYLI